MCQVETQNTKVMNMKVIMGIKYGAELIIAHTQVCHLMHRLVSMQQATLQPCRLPIQGQWWLPRMRPLQQRRPRRRCSSRLWTAGPQLWTACCSCRAPGCGPSMPHSALL